MDNPVGTIQAIYDSQAGPKVTVEVAAGSACPRCAAGNGCGAGLLTGGTSKRVVEAMAGDSMALEVGDTVQLRLAAANLLAAATLAYGTPLLGALAGTVLAFALQLSDIAATGAAIVGVAVGITIGRWRLRRDDCLRNFVPYVDKRL